MRYSSCERETNETRVKMSIDVDGAGVSEISTGIGFFDHMLTHVSKHGFMDIKIKAEGDIEVDCHHTVEDVGIVFGKCLNEAIGDKAGIKRYGNAIVPMDESLVLCAVDFSGRPYLNFDAKFTVDRLGDMDTEMFEEFFRALCTNCGLTLHIKMLDGKNNHHIAEAIFKAFGKAVDMALTYDERIKGVLSTKGMLEGNK